MVWIFAALVLPLLLFTWACSGHDGGGKTAVSTDTASVAKAPQPTANPTPIVIPTQDFTVFGIDVVDGSDCGPSGLNNDLHVQEDPVDAPNLLGLLSPLSVFVVCMGDFRPVDAGLTSALLTSNDLPSGYSVVAESTYSLPRPYDNFPITFSLFGKDHSESGAMVLVASIPLTPQSRPLIDTTIDSENIDALSSASDEVIHSFRILDSSGLGERGVGLQFIYDTNDFRESGGARPASNPLEFQSVIETYAFVVGDRLLAASVMWSADTIPDVDAHDLAEIMDQRAAANRP